MYSGEGSVAPTWCGACAPTRLQSYNGACYMHMHMHMCMRHVGSCGKRHGCRELGLRLYRVACGGEEHRYVCGGGLMVAVLEGGWWGVRGGVLAVCGPVVGVWVWVCGGSAGVWAAWQRLLGACVRYGRRLAV